jgi:hypothetical protein
VVQGASWQRCRVHTIRTQSPDWLTERACIRRRAVNEREHVADLQRILADDDAVDEQIQQLLLVVKAGVGQPRTDAFTKRGEACQDFLSSEAIAA